MHAIDLSNFQGKPSLQWFKDRINEGFSHFVIRVGDESAAHVDIALYQMRTAHEAGGTVSIYIWGYWLLNPRGSVQRMLNIANASGVPFQWVWVDAEDGESAGAGRIIDWLNNALDEIYSSGYNCGIYTGAWWWEGRAHLNGAFAHIPLWYSNYDFRDVIEWESESFGGWERPMVIAKQYRGDPLDLNVFEYPPGIIIEDDDDLMYKERAEELEAQVNDLINKVGYLTGDVANMVDKAGLKYKSTPKGLNKDLHIIAEEMRRNA